MKRHLFAITFLIAAFTLIAHDAIPHHHFAMDGSELNVDHIFSDTYEHHTKSKNDHDKPIPSHQHVYSTDDFIGRRSNDSLQKLIKISVANSICLLSLSYIFKNDITQNVVFNSIIILPDAYPFIISPNAMRGSPVEV